MAARMFTDIHAEIDDMSNARRQMLARVLYGYGYAPTPTCAEGVHESCLVVERCACDCHLNEEQYLAIHGVPRMSA
jgi:hypothetical protein